MNAILRILLSALVLTLLNSIRPMVSDDPSYYFHAQQFAQAPLRPYSGELWYAKRLRPAIENVAPPVLPYWLALGMTFVGDNPFLLKLWLFPFAAILAWALCDLLRRLAPGVETHLLWLTMLSASVLPSFDFMIDVPALALGLLAIAVFLRAADCSSVRLAILAGLVAGLAVQTKFNAITASGAIFAYGLIFRRERLALIAVLVAAGVFVAWEGFVYAIHGTSQFFILFFRGSHFEEGGARNLFKSLFRINGQVAAALIPLGVLAMGGRPWRTVAAMAGVAIALGLFATLPSMRVWKLSTTWLGVSLFATVALAGWHLRWDRNTQFLLAWLAVEVALSFVLSPFPAARRYLWMIVVMTLLLGRRLALGTPPAPALLCGVTVFGVIWGLGIWTAGLLDSLQEVSVTHRALVHVRKQDATGTVWYLADNWKATQYEAPRAGLVPVLHGRSLLKAGNWLVRDYDHQIEQHGIDKSRIETIEVYMDTSPFPLTILPDYFGGTYPIRHRSGCVIGVLYRIRTDFVPKPRSSARE